MIYQLDALHFTNEILPQIGRNTFIFYDPPYIESGEDLYLNNYTVNDHLQLAARISQLEQPWVCTYDYAAVQHNLYLACRRMVYGLPYTANARYQGKEVMFLSPSLNVPTEWSTARDCAVLLTHRRNDYRLYGMMEEIERKA